MYLQHNLFNTVDGRFYPAKNSKVSSWDPDNLKKRRPPPEDRIS